jgi:hypothetical protein
MPQAILVPIRKLFVARHLKGQRLGAIALPLGLMDGTARVGV